MKQSQRALLRLSGLVKKEKGKKETKMLSLTSLFLSNR
jgi:hypothetical protein